MRLTTEIGTTRLAELVKQVQAGNEILLTQDSQPVARIIPVPECQALPASPFRLRTFKGHRVMAATISQGDLAEVLFQR